MRGGKALLCLFLIFAGCATSGTGMGKKDEMEMSFKAADRFFYAKRFLEAKRSYETFLNQFPQNVLTPKAHFRLGEIAFHEGLFRDAILHYQKSVTRDIPPDWGAYAIYKLAVSHSRIDEPKKVLATLDRIPLDHGDIKVSLKEGTLRANMARKLDEPLEAIKGYLELIDAYESMAPSDRNIGDLNWVVGEKQAKTEIHQWIASEKKEEQATIGPLKDWMKRFDGKTSGGYLSWKIARLYHQKGDYENAEKWSRLYLQKYPKSEYVAEARAIVVETDKRGAVPEEGRSYVGVLLPLSGNFSVYGESVLHGLECAAGIFAPCRGDLGLNLLIRDSGGDPKAAARMVEEMAKNDDVKAVVGPLPQVEVDQATTVAEQGGLPMITLSQKPDVAKSGDYIFRNFLTVADQVATLVDYACGEKHWKKFAILYPKGAGGEEYKRVFEEEVGRCGGKLVAQASYPPETKDFTGPLRELKFSSAEETAEKTVNFDALFVPDVYRRIPRIVSALKFLKVEGVRLLGGAGWDHPDLVKIAGADVEGAIFVDGFFPNGTSFETRDFVTTFQAAYGIEPTLLEAYAYDTLRLLGEVLREHPHANRKDLQGLLAKKRNFSGVTGNISFDEDGDARRKISVLTVEQGAIKEIR